MYNTFAFYAVRIHDQYRRVLLWFRPAEKKHLTAQLYGLAGTSARLHCRKKSERLHWLLGSACAPSLRFGVGSAREYRARLKAVNKVTDKIIVSIAHDEGYEAGKKNQHYQNPFTDECLMMEFNDGFATGQREYWGGLY